LRRHPLPIVHPAPLPASIRRELLSLALTASRCRLRMPGVGDFNCWATQARHREVDAGRFDEYTLGVPLAGRTILDVGTASGFLTFETEKRGASVVSVDAASASRWDRLPFAQNPSFADRPSGRWERTITWIASSAHTGSPTVSSALKREYTTAMPTIFRTRWACLTSVVGQIPVHLSDVVRAITSISRRCGNTLIIAERVIFYGRANNPEQDHSF